jgi:predicted transcriptional regulator
MGAARKQKHPAQLQGRPTKIREQLHSLVDQLSEDNLGRVREFIEELNAASEPLSKETLAAIEEGLRDLQAGRTISLEDLERKYGL